MLNPQFIYFDLDDTLLDHRKAEKNALKDTWRHFGLFDSIVFDELLDTYHQVNKMQWDLYSKLEIDRDQLQRNRFELTLSRLDLDADQYDEVGSFYIDAYANHWEWMEGAKQAFDAIRNKFDVGILTNGFSETQKKKFERFNLYDEARHLVISEEVGYLKPHEKIFDYATQLTGYHPEQILYIGDSYSSDVVGGTNYGWKVGWYTLDNGPEQSSKADFTFSEFDHLTKLLNV